MKAFRRFSLLLSVAFLLAVSFVPEGGCSEDGASAERMAIVFTSDLKGEVHPDRLCGKDVRYAGGLAKRAELIKAIKASEPDSLLVDNGGLFSVEKYERNQEQAIRDAEIILSAYRILGYDAFTLGAEDLNYGAEFLERLQSDPELNLVTSNILANKNQAFIGKRYIIVEKGNLKVGVVSVMQLYGSQNIRKSVLEAVTVLSPVETVEKVVDELKDKVDFIILLSRLDSKASIMLADANKNIDLVFVPNGYGKNVKMVVTSAKEKSIIPNDGPFVGMSYIKLGKQREILEKNTRMIFAGPSVEEDYTIKKLIYDRYTKEKREAEESRKKERTESAMKQIDENLKQLHELSPFEYIERNMKKE